MPPTRAPSACTSRSASPRAAVPSSPSSGRSRPPYWKKRRSDAVVPVQGTRTEVGHVTRIRRAVHLHSRPHIDLQRVAGALCCS
ncbi:putative leader peptide [Streptomyces sp. NPDC057616]|uniref:putative leader peptide n=1 Tax=Streptomyces sp. NPDC057616 TaxID=3346183 RepID=UPI003697A103